MNLSLPRFLTLPILLIATIFTGCANIPKDLAGLEVDVVGVREFKTLPDGTHELVVTVRCRG